MVRAFVPVGFMPSSTPDVTALTICSGFGERVVYLDSHGEEHPAPVHDHHNNNGCSFALSSSFTHAAPILLFETPHVIALVREELYTTPTASTRVFKNFDAQGPPFFLS